MDQNFLKLNTEKTEILSVHPKSFVSSHHDFSINIDRVIVHPSPAVRNLGVLCDSSPGFEPHIKSCFYHIRNIVRLRRSLNFKDAKTVIHAFITSRLDYCNSLLYGLPNKALNHLQLIQNAAARALTYTKKSAHITPFTAITLAPHYLSHSV
ncbi:putative RNA-directed DNA polymerase from transposon BS [Labeo rohita]|uniref:RNA-directed DNA polymerase from transposon BS n=1 Tax=Labeo rohita TaxID=84645 RepID=A0ABQ8MAC3_LABRO|nr:putative RNA-directed DNA polymerase from transposon BS [Labeo rohita]